MESSWLKEISLTISTSFCWTSWNEAMGCPNCSLSLGVGQRRLVAVGGLPEPVPPDAVARVRQDRERRTETFCLRQPGALGDVAILHGDVRLPGGALGALAGEDVGPEARVVGLDEETQDLTFFGPGPDHGHVREGGVADPLLLPVENVAAVPLYRRRAE